MSSNLLFELPYSQIEPHPVSRRNSRVNIGFIEVGCRPVTKCGQLRTRLDQFKQYWDAAFVTPGVIDWYPTVRRTLVHFDKLSHKEGVFNSGADYKEFNPDVILFYEGITDEQINSLTLMQKEELLKKALKKDVRADLEKMLLNNDSQALTNLVTSQHHVSYGGIRGKLAETVALNEIDAYKPRGVKLYANEEIQFFSRGESREVDGLLLWYNQAPYWRLIDNLQANSSVTVLVNRDISRL